MRYLIFGAGGMAGHLITTFLMEKGEIVVGVARRELPFCQTVVLDVRDEKKVRAYLMENTYDIIINCIGILNKVAEDDPAQAVYINAYLPHLLADCTKDKSTKIIHMSTDCVFSGIRGGYVETDFPDGETYYARTKALGELVDDKNLTFRNSIIGPDINAKGIGLFHWFIRQSGSITGYEKSLWNGVTTLTLAKAMYQAAHSSLTGLYNLSNNTVINKYQLLCLFKKYTGSEVEISPVPGVDHDKSLINTRNDFDFVVPSYEDQVKEMVTWIKEHKELYPEYRINA